MKKWQPILLASATIFAVAESPVNATTIFTDRSLFLAAAGTIQTETFNSYSTNISLEGTTLDTGLLTVDGTASTFLSIDALTGSYSPGDGTSYLLGLGFTGESIMFTFNSPIKSFGLDMYAVNDEIERSRIIINGITYTLPTVATLVASFFGIVSDDEFSSVQLLAVAGEQAGYDNVTFGSPSPVPIPAALPLLAAGLGAMGFMGWRRKRKAAG